MVLMHLMKALERHNCYSNPQQQLYFLNFLSQKHISKIGVTPIEKLRDSYSAHFVKCASSLNKCDIFLDY